MTGKCEACAKLKEQLLKYRKIPALRKVFFKRRDAHFRDQRTERQHYYKKILMSLDEPDKYMSIIVDGMDMFKCALPRFRCALCMYVVVLYPAQGIPCGTAIASQEPVKRN